MERRRPLVDDRRPCVDARRPPATEERRPPPATEERRPLPAAGVSVVDRRRCFLNAAVALAAELTLPRRPPPVTLPRRPPPATLLRRGRPASKSRAGEASPPIALPRRPPPCTLPRLPPPCMLARRCRAAAAEPGAFTGSTCDPKPASANAVPTPDATMRARRWGSGARRLARTAVWRSAQPLIAFPTSAGALMRRPRVRFFGDGFGSAMASRSDDSSSTALPRRALRHQTTHTATEPAA